jgi:sigma-E factor negative regulatory protein RseC
MLETRAIVVRVEGTEVIVEAMQGSGCGHCNSEKGCGTAARLFCSQPRRFRVRNEMNAGMGDVVQVSVADGVLLRSVAILYGLPLALMLAGALLGSRWAEHAANSDFPAAIGALLGMVSGFALARLISSRKPVFPSAQPVIVQGK